MIEYTLNLKDGQITITENGIGDIGVSIPLKNCAVFIQEGLLSGMYRADYLLQIMREQEGYPSKFSIAKKLSKYKKHTDGLTSIGELL